MSIRDKDSNARRLVDRDLHLSLPQRLGRLHEGLDVGSLGVGRQVLWALPVLDHGERPDALAGPGQLEGLVQQAALLLARGLDQRLGLELRRRNEPLANNIFNWRDMNRVIILAFLTNFLNASASVVSNVA